MFCQFGILDSSLTPSLDFQSLNGVWKAFSGCLMSIFNDIHSLIKNVAKSTLLLPLWWFCAISFSEICVLAWQVFSHQSRRAVYTSGQSPSGLELVEYPVWFSPLFIGKTYLTVLAFSRRLISTSLIDIHQIRPECLECGEINISVPSMVVLGMHFSKVCVLHSMIRLQPRIWKSRTSGQNPHSVFWSTYCTEDQNSYSTMTPGCLPHSLSPQNDTSIPGCVSVFTPPSPINRLRNPNSP